LETLYEDPYLLAVNKPAGLPIHPAGGRLRGTLIQSVRQAFRLQIQRSLEAGDPGFYPSLVHRLDLFSSGVVLIAKDRTTLVAMHRLVAGGRWSKRYLALVRGEVSSPRGRIEGAIGPDPSSRVRIRRCIGRTDCPRSRSTRCWSAWPGTHTPVYLTGRRHQIGCTCLDRATPCGAT
jgi:23S rRNA pseudouridine1911/1915/1917 synthase